jgi:acyl-CoA synthetase (AMP-forming)/AMP-acid ligase II
VGRPDPEAGEIPVAFVVLKGGVAATAEELLDYCAQNVSPYKKTRQVIFKYPLLYLFCFQNIENVSIWFSSVELGCMISNHNR